MPHGTASAHIPAPSAEVFRLLHDYSLRLKWDTLLQSAQLSPPWTEAQLHAVSICKGRAFLGGIALESEYIAFTPPHVAAVKMLNRPPFFETFAATIRHQDLPDGVSRIDYTYNFTARPKALCWLLHPLMSLFFKYETQKRLNALRCFFEKRNDATRTLPLPR